MSISECKRLYASIIEYYTFDKLGIHFLSRTNLMISSLYTKTLHSFVVKNLHMWFISFTKEFHLKIRLMMDGLRKHPHIIVVRIDEQVPNYVECSIFSFVT